VYYLLIDLDEIDEIVRRIRPFSYNRLNVLSLRDCDHMGAPGRGIRASVHDHLVRRGIDPATVRVALLTNTRVLNYVFNPVSFYLVRGREDGELRAVLAEVHNTSGERHVYDLDRAPESAAGRYVSAADKSFYVSPFIEMQTRYAFEINEQLDGRLGIRIDEFDEHGRFFEARLDVSPMPLTNANVARMLARYPLITLQTIGLIHWHGLKLWLRGVRYQSNPRRRREERT
jgi:DUF1365 family protein